MSLLYEHVDKLKGILYRKARDQDTEIKFLHLVLLEMALSHASQAQCGG